MVQTQADLEAEVNDLILAGIDAGHTMPASWIVEEIVEKHPGINGKDRDFYKLCAYKHVRATVRICLRAYKEFENPNLAEQLVLPGYEHLQKGYLVEREDQQVIVPLVSMTKAEATAKIMELRRMAKGCLKHADELERWIEEHLGN